MLLKRWNFWENLPGKLPLARPTPRAAWRADPRAPAAPPRPALLAAAPRAGGPPARPRATTPRPRPAYFRKKKTKNTILTSSQKQIWQITTFCDCSENKSRNRIKQYSLLKKINEIKRNTVSMKCVLHQSSFLPIPSKYWWQRIFEMKIYLIKRLWSIKKFKKFNV